MKKIIGLVGIAIAFAAVFAGLSPVQSAPADLTFSVNDQGDAVDNNIGDAICRAASGKCTLRAAIQEANAQYAGHPGTMYTITVPGGTFLSGPRVYPLKLAGSADDNTATDDLDIKGNLLISSTTGLGAAVDATGLGDRVFHVIQPPSGPISVTFVSIWID